jgi:hypothetical protein
MTLRNLLSLSGLVKLRVALDQRPLGLTTQIIRNGISLGDYDPETDSGLRSIATVPSEYYAAERFRGFLDH